MGETGKNEAASLVSKEASPDVKGCPWVPGSVRRAKKWNYKEEKNGWLFRNATEKVATMESQSVNPSGMSVSSRGGYEIICSYNWTHHEQPTIYAPGQPRKWAPKDLPITVPKDSGVQHVDQNASRLPKYPFEAVFRAMEVLNPDTRFDSIDVLINRNTLRKLFDFCKGSCREDWRIQVYMVGETLVVERCERNAKIIIYGSTPSGFGHSFEDAITDCPAGLEDMTAHHRVLTYNIGALSCAVRFEVDAYRDLDEKGPAEVRHNKTNPETAKGKDANVQSLEDGFNKLAIQSCEKPSVPKQHSPQSIQVIPRGSMICHSAATELKTSSKNKPLSQVMPQLWFGRTATLVRGYHTNGTFTRIAVDDVGASFQTWEETHQVALRKMSELLAELRGLAKKMPGEMGIVVCESKVKPLAIRVFAAKHQTKPLPEDVITKFWTKAAEAS